MTRSLRLACNDGDLDELTDEEVIARVEEAIESAGFETVELTTQPPGNRRGIGILGADLEDGTALIHPDGIVIFAEDGRTFATADLAHGVAAMAHAIEKGAETR
jgi:hypothetical protein